MKKIKLATAENKLEKYVIRWLNNTAKEYNSINEVYCTLCDKRCISGFVEELADDPETTAFFRRFRDEINTLLGDLMLETQLGIEVLFGRMWDGGDPLALEKPNQTILAWFGFEEAARIVCDRVGIPV